MGSLPNKGGELSFLKKGSISSSSVGMTQERRRDRKEQPKTSLFLIKRKKKKR